MALTTIKTNTAVTTIEVGGVDVSHIVDTVSTSFSAPIENITVFADEQTGGETSVGTEQVTYGLAGPLRFGAAGTTPFIPISAYQDVSIEVTYATDCSVSSSANFNASDPGRVTTAAGRYSASAVSNGTIVVDWDDAGS